MTRADLIALAARVEQAQGPDRELDAAVMRLFTNSIESDDGEWWYGPHDEPPRKVPDFTASRDAARSLLPAGWHLTIGDCEDWPWADAHEFPLPCRRVLGVHAATVPLTMLAAALRARAEEV